MVEAHTSRLDSTFGSNSLDKTAGFGNSVDAANPSAKFLAEYIKPASDPKSDQPQSSNCLVDFAKSTVNSAIVDPMRAVAQIIDNSSSQTHYDKNIQNVANSFGLTPSAPAEFGTARYFGQQLGNAVGMMIPFMLLRGGGGAIAGKLSRSSLAAVEETSMQAPKLLKIAGHEAFASGATGFAYGTLLRTTDDQTSKSSFWEKRIHQGAADMATFGVLGFTTPFVGKSLNSLASSIERSAATDATSLAVNETTNFAPPLAKNVLAESLRSPIVAGSLSSIPTGLWNAEMQARSDGRWIPTGTELKENLVSMAFVGGAFGGAHSLYARATGAHENSTGKNEEVDTGKEQPTSTGKQEIASGQREENIPRTFESPEQANQQFRTYIEERKWREAADLVGAGAIEPNVVKDEATVRAIRDGFDNAAANRKWDEVNSILKFGVIPQEHYASPAIKTMALQDLALFVGEQMKFKIPSILELNILSESDLKNSPDLRRITMTMLKYCFKESENDSLNDFRSYSWVDTSLLHDAALEKLSSTISYDNLHAANELTKRIQELNFASESDLRATGQQALSKRLANGHWESLADFGNQFYGDNWAQEPALRSAAEQRVQQDLPKGELNSAETASKHNLLPPDFFQTESNKKLAVDGLNHLMTNEGAADEIAAHHEQITAMFGKLSPEDYRASAVEALAPFIDGPDVLREYTDMAREKLNIEFSSEEFRAAARERLTEHLRYWDTNKAQTVMDMNILTADDIKDAAAAAIPRSIHQNEAIAAHIPKEFDVDAPRIKAALHDYVATGNITNTLRAAMLHGSDLNSAISEYLGIEKLSNETARALYERLKKEDSVWTDRRNVGNLFDVGVSELGEARMLRFTVNPRVNPHDALLGFDHVVKMYKNSGMTPEAFEGKILSQVSRDSGIDDQGSAFSHLQSIAKSYPENPEEFLARARQSSIPELKSLADSFNDSKDAMFSDWNTLKRFAKMQHLLEQKETFEKLDQLENSGQANLAAWLKTLMFHPDSRISLDSIMKFWHEPGEFLDLDDKNTGKAHELKKPSNYTDIPHLDMTPVQLRDALIDGTLDKLQVFHPMRVEYDLAPNVDFNKEFDQALGSRREQRKGTAKNVQKLFSEVNRLLKSDAPGYTVNDLVSSKEPPANVREKLMDLLYTNDIGIPKPDAKLRLIAEIHRKSDPIAVLAGDDTVSCMGFGTGKNNIYMFNPNDAQFTVRIVNQEGKVRTFAQSVLTKDQVVKETVPNIVRSMDNNDKAQIHELLSSDALRSEPSVIAADNVEVHPKYSGPDHQLALEAVYTDFFNRYLQQFGETQNLRTDKIVIGIGYTDAMKGLPQEPNTYVPQAPVAYSDKTHETVYRLDMDKKSAWTATPTKLEVTDKNASRQQKPSAIEGIAPLTFEDTLPVAWLESKAYQDNPSMVEGLHNMENSLIAQSINNTAKERPNMSLKYTSPDGATQGYLVAYEGKFGDEGNQKPVLFVSDYSTDRQTGRNGSLKAGRAGGKLLQGFMELYKREYLDKGDLTPVLANAREETSYKLLLDNLKVISKRIGYSFDVQEVGAHKSGTSVMHDILIVPRKK